MPEITIKAMLKWLDGQRDAVNARIIASPPENQGRYMPELQVINAIAERVQEMTAVEYLKATREIADAYCDHVHVNGCMECPFYTDDFSGGMLCSFDVTTRNPRKTVTIVKRWKEEQDE